MLIYTNMAFTQFVLCVFLIYYDRLFLPSSLSITVPPCLIILERIFPSPSSPIANFIFHPYP